MRITFLGTGTSQGVPVIACQCSVCQSHDTKDKRLRASILIEYDGYTLVVDTGPDFRYQMLREKVQHLDAILITHAHKDHIAGMDDVRAFNFLQNKPMPIYGQINTLESLKREFYYAFGQQKFSGIPQLELIEIYPGTAIELHQKKIMPVEVMHHKMPVLGFRIDDFAYITDAKTISEESMKLLEGVQYLVLNALQRDPHISHLTLDEALSISAILKPRKTLLTHISHRFGTDAEISRMLPTNVELAYDGLKLEL